VIEIACGSVYSASVSAKCSGVERKAWSEADGTTGSLLLDDGEGRRGEIGRKPTGKAVTLF